MGLIVVEDSVWRHGDAGAYGLQSQGAWKCNILFAIFNIFYLKWWSWNYENTEITSNKW